MLKLDDGTIMFPKRGKPPPDIPNYVRDPGDPFKFTPAFQPCDHRVLESRTTPCRRVICLWSCTAIGQLVSPRMCQVCTIEPKVRMRDECDSKLPEAEGRPDD